MKKLICPKCGSDKYISFVAKNEVGKVIVENFFCPCLHSGDKKELKKESIFDTIKKFFNWS